MSAKKVVTESLFVATQDGTLVQYLLEPRPKAVASADKVSEDMPLDLGILGHLQWTLSRSVGLWLEGQSHYSKAPDDDRDCCGGRSAGQWACGLRDRVVYCTVYSTDLDDGLGQLWWTLSRSVVCGLRDRVVYCTVYSTDLDDGLGQLWWTLSRSVGLWFESLWLAGLKAIN